MKSNPKYIFKSLEWFREKQIKFEYGPPHSLDLNPIENGWWLKIK